MARYAATHVLRTDRSFHSHLAPQSAATPFGVTTMPNARGHAFEMGNGSTTNWDSGMEKTPGLVRSRFRACVMASTWSSFRPFGNEAHSSMKPSTQGALAGCGKYTLPDSICGDTPWARAILPPSGLTSINPA